MAKDLTGQRFGKLIALRPTKERKQTSVVWECRCDCGNTAFVDTVHLTKGKTRSCGCLRKERASEQKKNDLSGLRFGRLVALRPTEERKRGFVVWECQCDCGQVAYVTTAHLVQGITQSCGCLQKERTNEVKAKDLTGQRFGRLVALRPTEERRHGLVVWECQCDCGNTAFVIASSLMRGKTTSCGCFRKERMAEASRIDLTGKRFGRLMVLKYTEERRNQRIVWECQCDCGNIVTAIAPSLINGRTTSCGCLQNEQVVETSTKDLTGQRFGQLIAIKPMEERKNGSIMWECQCDCGNTTFVRSNSLLSGNTKSCGCLRARRI